MSTIKENYRGLMREFANGPNLHWGTKEGFFKEMTFQLSPEGQLK